MDVEKTIEFLLEQQAAQQARFDAKTEFLLEQQAAQQARFDAKTEFLLEQQAAQQARFDAKTEFLLEQQTAHQARFDGRMESLLEQQTAQQARFEAKMEFLLEQQAAQEARLGARMDSLGGIVAEMAGAITDVQHQLRRAVKLGVEEARRQRAQRRALEQKVDTRFGEFATAQLATERSLQRLIDSLQQGHNGHDRT